MQDFTSVEKLQHATVYGTDGDKIGSVGQVYLDDQTNQPTFVTVKTGLFGMKETFVPVSQATQSQDGLQVPFDKAFIKDAPNIDADGSLTPEEERRIYEYYSLDYPAGGRHAGDARDSTRTGGAGIRQDTDPGRTAASGTAAGGVGGLGVQRGDANDTAADLDRDVNTGGAGRDGGIHTTGTGGADTRGVDTDRESVVVRDEQLDVGTEVRETGQVRLRKHTYTDTETVEVPVSKEEVVVERETIDPDSPEALRNTGDEEVVVTTREEVPVVDKTATAEKVTVDKNRVQDTERVSGTVQHEDVEVEGEGDAGRRR
ncbi:MAG: hypothetical protein MOP51_77 [Citricoccus sp.]|jgi:uncharacterized protein (TIGR02271 family)|nr:hypothetical protein [Citricoccus sp. WCRC_4]